MILIDTSIYIEAAEKEDVRELIEAISKKSFVLSCDPIEKEIDEASDFLRGINKKEDSEKLKGIYNEIKQGKINLTDRIKNLRDQYINAANHLSKDQKKWITNDLLIVASASVAGVNHILSLNRKTMAAYQMVEIYTKINKLNGYKTPAFITTIEGLVQFLQSL